MRVHATRDSVDSGGHGHVWYWVCCPGHAHADMAQPVPVPAEFVEMG